ncbi:Ribosomal protein L25/L23 [Desulfofarcimen acetoxidans DSM 771]|jgi:large subunit ribosomal protein L23|uniref:Large ribosomal subunit protein uL23 n=2 Tax=Desulfofarcimen acetoxidans TaxID=58138 RepID=C8W3Y7_DESAS|nr:Ribosomal protein L25/L23 [Desulfofarcimen acetoxidans DSM 771]
MEARDILRKPIVTEKTMALLEDNKYSFLVDIKANKSEIKKAVEQIFKVKVEKVNTLIVKGKPKRVRNSVGRTSDVKKAIVKLREGDKIELFEGI